MKKKNKKIHLNKLIIVRSIFVLIFIASLFSTINAFANTNPFKIIDAVISDKSEGSLNLGNLFNTSSSTTMYAMFSGCKAMESLNLGNSFNTAKVTNMFNGDSKLTTIYAPTTFVTTAVGYIYCM